MKVQGDHSIEGNLPIEVETNLRDNTETSSGFESPYLEVIDQKAEDVAGGDFDGQDAVGGAYANWTSRDLTDVIRNDFATSITAGGIDIDVDEPRIDTGDPADDFTGEITLEAGTYYIEASAPAFSVNEHVARLADTTDASGVNAPTVVMGSSEYAADSSTWVALDGLPDSPGHTHVVTGNTSQSRSNIRGRFSLQSQRTLEVQHRCTTTQATSGLGSAADFYESSNVFTQIQLWLLSNKTSTGRGSQARAGAPALPTNSLVVTDVGVPVSDDIGPEMAPIITEGNQALGLVGEYTVSVWMKHTYTGNTGHKSNRIVGMQDTISPDINNTFQLSHLIDPDFPNDDYAEVRIYSSTGNILRAVKQVDGATATGGDGSEDFNLVQDTWYHHIIAVDNTKASGSEITWRTNGDLGAHRYPSTGDISTLVDLPRQLSVGNQTAAASEMRGMTLYYAAFWNRALSYDEMTAVYNGGAGIDLLYNQLGYVSQRYLAHYYKFGATGAAADIGTDYALGTLTPKLDLVQDNSIVGELFTDDDIVATTPSG